GVEVAPGGAIGDPPAPHRAIVAVALVGAPRGRAGLRMDSVAGEIVDPEILEREASASMHPMKFAFARRHIAADQRQVADHRAATAVKSRRSCPARPRCIVALDADAG